MDYIGAWWQEIQERGPVKWFVEPIETTATFKRYGGGDLFARVTVRFEPAESFEVSISPEMHPDYRREFEAIYMQPTVFGVLDVLIGRRFFGVHLIMLDCRIHAVDSRPIAFHMAGRMAATQAIEVYEKRLADLAASRRAQYKQDSTGSG